MTPASVRARVATISAVADDPEVAHSLEDDVHLSVLRAIASGAPDAVELAAEAIKTADIRFARWHG